MILADVSDQFKHKARVSFQLSSEFDWYTVEATSFKRIFANLFSNAVKAAASKIEVIGKLQNSTLVISIRDNGKGIPIELQPYIFEKGITSNKSSGHGLGLNYVKEKLTEMGYKITVAETSHRGTTFEIVLPLHEIILIDDNPIIKETWVTLGAKIGVRVHCFETEERIINEKKLSRNTPVFIDYNLKFSNGENVANRIKEAGFKIVSLATGESRRISNLIYQSGKEFPIKPKLSDLNYKSS